MLTSPAFDVPPLSLGGKKRGITVMLNTCVYVFYFFNISICIFLNGLTYFKLTLMNFAGKRKKRAPMNTLGLSKSHVSPGFIRYTWFL